MPVDRVLFDTVSARLGRGRARIRTTGGEMLVRTFMSFIAAVAALCSIPWALAAEQMSGYPSRPIRLIVANTTGTSVDTLARVLAAKMSEELGQQIVADNRAGAGGIIGAEIASQAAPDGYT